MGITQVSNRIELNVIKCYTYTSVERKDYEMNLKLKTQDLIKMGGQDFVSVSQEDYQEAVSNIESQVKALNNALQLLQVDKDSPSIKVGNKDQTLIPQKNYQKLQTILSSSKPKVDNKGIVQLRKALKLDKCEFARRINKSDAVVGIWESGSSKPSRATLKAIHKEFGDVALQYLPEINDPEPNVKALQKALNLTGPEMAKALDVSAGTVYQWVKGKSFPREDKIDRMKKALKYTRTQQLP